MSNDSNKYIAIMWAREILKSKNAVFLDTETAQMNRYQKQFLVELTAISRYGNTLIDTLIKPPSPITESAMEIHGITNEMVEDAPEFPEIYPKLKEIVEGKKVCVYDLHFTDTAIANSCKYYGLPPIYLEDAPVCVKNIYREAFGWRYPVTVYKYHPETVYGDTYKCQKLVEGYHRAKIDCRFCFDLVNYIAETPRPKFEPKNPKKLFPAKQFFCDWKDWAAIIKKGKHDDFKVLIRLSYPIFSWRCNAEESEDLGWWDVNINQLKVYEEYAEDRDLDDITSSIDQLKFYKKYGEVENNFF